MFFFARNYAQTYEKNPGESEAVPPVHPHFAPFFLQNKGAFFRRNVCAFGVKKETGIQKIREKVTCAFSLRGVPVNTFTKFQFALVVYAWLLLF